MEYLNDPWHLSGEETISISPASSRHAIEKTKLVCLSTSNRRVSEIGVVRCSWNTDTTWTSGMQEEVKWGTCSQPSKAEINLTRM